MTVALENVEREFAKLWASTSRKDSHAMTLNLVVFCASPDDLPRARGVITQVALNHPCRTISIGCYPSEIPSISARVALHLNASRGGEPVGEDIDLDVRGAARQWVPSTLVRLRASGVPVCVWWVGDLPDQDTLYDRLVEHADVVFIHSADMDLGDLGKLARLVEWAKGSYAISDLNWARLRSWQEFTARFFDDPAARPCLASLREVTVEYSPRAPERASTQAALYVGWLASALSWSSDGARWEGSTVKLPRGTTLRFVAVDRPDLSPGAINRVELLCGNSRFEVKRAEDPLVLCWDGEGEGLVIPSQCVRIGTPDEGKMLSRLLERPERDALFERSLGFAARLIEQGENSP